MEGVCGRLDLAVPTPHDAEALIEDERRGQELDVVEAGPARVDATRPLEQFLALLKDNAIKTSPACPANVLDSSRSLSPVSTKRISSS